MDPGLMLTCVGSGDVSVEFVKCKCMARTPVRVLHPMLMHCGEWIVTGAFLMKGHILKVLWLYQHLAKDFSGEFEKSRRIHSVTNNIRFKDFGKPK